jgi:hypothetical protein
VNPKTMLLAPLFLGLGWNAFHYAVHPANNYSSFIGFCDIRGLGTGNSQLFIQKRKVACQCSTNILNRYHPLLNMFSILKLVYEETPLHVLCKWSIGR